MKAFRRFVNPVRVSEECALQTLNWLGQAMDLNESGLATIAISGGSSPRAMFEVFAGMPFSWSRVHLFWVDERMVPPTDSQSNYKLAKETWLDSVQFPETNIHRVPTELPEHEAAQQYAAEIRQVFQLTTGQLPRFDVIHRGMGPDAHTASLFPGEPLIEDRTGIAAAVWVEKFSQWRVTLLPGVLEAARHTAMLVIGADKAPALDQVLNGPYDPLHFPAQLATRNGGDAVWFVDAAAAGQL